MSRMRQVLSKDCGTGVSQKGRQDQALGAGAPLPFLPRSWNQVVGRVTSAGDPVSEDHPLGMKDRSFLLFLMAQVGADHGKESPRLVLAVGPAPGASPGFLSILLSEVCSIK